MRILLSGATGFIGKSFVDSCYKDYEIHCIVRQTSDTRCLDNKVAIHRFSELKQLYDVASEIRPDVLIHLAGLFLSNHDEDSIEELLHSNIVFSTVLFDAVNEAGCNKILNFGSYWQNYNGEDYCPVNLYAATKQSVEDILRFYSDAKGSRVITLALFDTYGKNDKRKKILNIVNDLRDGDVLEMTGGEQRVYMVHISDIIKAIRITIDMLFQEQKGGYQKFFLRDENPIRLRDLVNLLIRVHNKSVGIKYGVRPYRDREIMNPEGIGQVLPGWKPEVSLEDGLRNMIKK